jgi:hypothetical protein
MEGDMVDPHPKEDHIVGGVNADMTWLAYFAARCPLKFQWISDTSTDQSYRTDCAIRVEWARAMLHELWPVAAQNSGTAK